MSDFLVISTATLEAYRLEQGLPDYSQRFGDYYELQPIKLYERDAYALPIDVLDHPAFATVREQLLAAPIEELTAEDFEWWHTQEIEP